MPFIMTDPSDWSFFGWQGLSFEVPDTWSLSRAEGDRRQGYIRLDDGELVRLEARWEKQKSKQPVAAVVGRYLETLEKAARKKKTRLKLRRGFTLANLPGKECESFSAKGDVDSIGLLSRCDECKRVVLIRVIGRKPEPLERIAKRVFRSMQDHATGLERWGVYDMEFRVPAAARLERTFLRAGRLELLFSHKQAEIEILRSGVAELVLRNQTVDQWFRKLYAKRVRSFSLGAPEQTKVRGHEAHLYSGGIRAGRRIASLLIRKRYAHCYLWRCGESDKLFVVRVTSREPKGETARALAEQVVCHRDS